MDLFKVTIEYTSPYELKKWGEAKNAWEASASVVPRQYPEPRPLKVAKKLIAVKATWGPEAIINAITLAVKAVIGKTDSATMEQYEVVVKSAEYFESVHVEEP